MGTIGNKVAPKQWDVYDKLEIDNKIVELAPGKIDDSAATITNTWSASKINTELSSKVNTGAMTTALSTKQDTLVSGTNIKTINGSSILGSGNINTPTTTVNNTLTSTSTTEALSAAQGKVLQDTKVAANTAITAGTGTKVTYDTKGLVTGSTALVATDIPVLDASKITTGILPVLRGGTGVTTSTGTGNVVLSNSPTLVTPVLGVATGTSFNAITGLASVAPLMNSTAAVGTSTLAARQDHIHGSDTTKANLASPALTGTPTAPTAAVGTNTTQLATTAFVNAEIANDMFSKTELTMAIGNINSPLLDMPLKNSLAMKAGVGSATFTRASTATYIDRYGVLKTATVDEPRFEKEGYLNEGASTNLLIYSEQFNNAAWTTAGIASKTTDGTLAPDGVSLMYKITSNGLSSEHYVQQTVAISSDATRCGSLYIKYSDVDTCAFALYGTGGTTITKSTLFTFSTKTLSNNTDFRVEEISNGVFRISGVITSVSNTSNILRMFVGVGGLTTQVGSVYVFGAQLEALPFQTSYIPTVASTVTRAADVLRVTYENNSIGYKDRFSEETLSIDFSKFADILVRYLFAVGTNDTAYRFYVTATSVIGQFGSDSSGGSQLSSGTIQNYVKNRFVLSHSTAGITKMYTNGALANQGTSGTTNSTGNPTGLWIGNNGGATGVTFGHITNVRIFDKCLTAQEVALC